MRTQRDAPVGVTVARCSSHANSCQHFKQKGSSWGEDEVCGWHPAEQRGVGPRGVWQDGLRDPHPHSNTLATFLDKATRILLNLEEGEAKRQTSKLLALAELPGPGCRAERAEEIGRAHV